MANTGTQIPSEPTSERVRDRPSSSSLTAGQSAVLPSAPVIRSLPSPLFPTSFPFCRLGHHTPLALLPGEDLILSAGIKDSWRVSLTHLPYILTTIPTIRITDRRIIIQVKKKFLGITFYMKEESFNCDDLQQLSLRSSLDFPRGFFSLLLFVGVIVVTALKLAQSICLAFLISAILVSLAAVVNTASNSTLNLDFYRNETVHSWLPFLGFGAGALRHGSSIRKKIEMPTGECMSCLIVLYEHDKTQFAEDKRTQE